jgi:RNA polymerase sigma factor (sigma-70 family)
MIGQRIMLVLTGEPEGEETMLHASQQEKRVLRGQEVPDGVLVSQALAGDQRAFECLLNRYQQPLLSHIASMIRDGDLASDVLQHVFFQLYVSLSTLSTDVPLKSWLFRVAHNRCLDELRRKHRRTEIPFSTFEWDCGEEEISPIGGVPDLEPLPEEVAEFLDLHALLQRATFSLPPKFRLIVQLHCFKQLSFKEIGRTLEMPEPTVKSYYYRSLPLLRKRLASDRHAVAIS